MADCQNGQADPKPQPEFVIRVAVLYPADPAGHIPSGIDTFIRGVLKWAPPDIEYTLFGATSDTVKRPLDREAFVPLDKREARCIPIVGMDPSGTRKILPLTVRYIWALRNYVRRGELKHFDVLDFHRIEPVCLFMHDVRPKNVVLHQDMSVLRNSSADIMWRHAPWLYEAVERRLFKCLDRIFCVRQIAVERYAAKHAQLARRFMFIPTWVDTEVFRPPEDGSELSNHSRSSLLRQIGISESARILVSVGRLDHQKDPLLLIEAFRKVASRYADLRLVLIGDGVLRTRVQDACAAAGIRSKVCILGARPAHDIAGLLRASDLFVLSSAYEGMPIAVLEALASGVPVVTTDVGEVRLVVRDGVSGYIASERTADALENAICRALDRLELLRGGPCTRSVASFHPQIVLSQIYDNHRRQAHTLAA